MNKPKPKFCVGEEVAVVSAAYPEFNTPRTEIVSVKWIRFSDEEYPCWGYHTVHRCVSKFRFHESALRKLPPEDRTQWSDCEWMPRETVK